MGLSNCLMSIPGRTDFHHGLYQMLLVFLVLLFFPSFLLFLLFLFFLLRLASPTKWLSDITLEGLMMSNRSPLVLAGSQTIQAGFCAFGGFCCRKPLVG